MIKLELLNHHWHVIVLGFNDQMLMKVTISLAMWTFTRKMLIHGGSTTSPQFECGCNMEQY